ncbi:MAG: putative DNA-binding protein (MmcQ/YjbR family) [Bradymonadia bacterium]|jgi:predicted DNA-binding protein (MmcQ/YjbR family)
MDVELVRELCLNKPRSEESAPFGPDVLVYKVGDKIFANISLGDTEMRVIAKCDPARVDELRAENPGIVAPRYFNKKHWNSISLDDGVPPSLIEELVQHSYEVIVAKLTKKLRHELGIGT